MLQLSTAIQLVLDYANKSLGGTKGERTYVVNKTVGIIEKDTFWYIPFTEQDPATQVGFFGVHKGVIIDKKQGKITPLGTSYPREDWIWAYERGFSDKHIDFTITKINNRKLAIEQLNSLGPQYLHYKEDGNYTVEDIKYYTAAAIEAKLHTLPCTFRSQNFTSKIWVLQEIEQSNSFEYSLKETNKKYGLYYGELIKKDNKVT